MCTNFALIKKDGTAKLADHLGVDARSLIYNHNFRPADKINIIIGSKDERLAHHAIWWLYLQQTDSGLKPHKDYFSVNTNHAKLPKKTEYKTSRCIIPASSFIESQNGKHPHLLEPVDGSAIAFGGLYKQWTDKMTGEIIYSASIITLAGHPALADIHKKSTPLWLAENNYDQWLDPDIKATDCFRDLLNPTLQKDLNATPIDKVFSKNVIGESFIVGNSI